MLKAVSSNRKCKYLHAMLMNSPMGLLDNPEICLCVSVFVCLTICEYFRINSVCVCGVVTNGKLYLKLFQKCLEDDDVRVIFCLLLVSRHPKSHKTDTSTMRLREFRGLVHNILSPSRFPCVPVRCNECYYGIMYFYRHKNPFLRFPPPLSPSPPPHLPPPSLLSSSSSMSSLSSTACLSSLSSNRPLLASARRAWRVVTPLTLVTVDPEEVDVASLHLKFSMCPLLHLWR